MQDLSFKFRFFFVGFFALIYWDNFENFSLAMTQVVLLELLFETIYRIHHAKKKE